MNVRLHKGDKRGAINAFHASRFSQTAVLSACLLYSALLLRALLMDSGSIFLLTRVYTTSFRRADRDFSKANYAPRGNAEKLHARICTNADEKFPSCSAIVPALFAQILDG